MRIDDGGYSTYTPPVHTDPSPSDTTQHGNGPHIQTVAAPARANPPPATPAQKVDLAVAKYKAAVASGDQDAIKQARQDVNTAVKDEIGPQVDTANRGVPAQFRTLTDKQIDSYGNVILRRNDGDATTQGVLKDAIKDYQIQRKADDLIPQFYGDFTPKEKLDSLKLSLQGQTPQVVARAMQNPAVQRMLQDAASWIAEPYKGLSGNELKWNQQAALEASQRLADIAADLPPDQVAQLVKQSMPTIKNIAGVDANYSGSTAFTNLSKVVGSLGDTPQAEELTKQIAQDYRGQFNTWEGRFDDTHTGIIKAAVGAGASPKLALELAAQLKADGKTEEAGVVLRSVERGVEDLQSNIKKDVQEYNELTKDLNWVVANSKDKLTPAQLQKAIDAYIAKQDPSWQGKLKEVEEHMTTDVESLKEDIGQLEGLPEDLKELAPDAFEELKSNVGHDETVENAIKFATNRDPSIFEGESGDKFMTFLIEEGHHGKDFVESLGKSYVAGHVLPAVKDFNALHPDSVAKAYKALDDLRSKGSLLGLPQNEVNANIDKLKELVTTLNTTKSTEEALAAFDELHGDAARELKELKGMTLSQGPAGLAFRVIGLGIAGAAARNATSEAFEDPNYQTLLGSLATNVGLANDSIGFGKSINMLDSEGALARWTERGGENPKWWEGGGEKLFGALTIAYFAAGAVQDYKGGDTPAAVFDVAGAGGAALATFGETIGLGSWAGPVGWGVAIVATGLVEAAKYGHETKEHTELAENFLKGAGIEEDAAKSLSGDALREATTLQQQLHLSPEQLQELAVKHPEVLTGNRGATQSVADVASANGIKGEDVLPFLDAVAKDDPNYVQTFAANGENKDTASPLSHAANLFNLVQRMPNAAAFVKAHSPQLVGPDADARRQADVAYESSDRSPEQVAGLLSKNHNAAYQAEMINVMKQNNTLDAFVREVGTNDHYNGWPEAAKAAIQSAANAGIITQAQAHDYLAQVA
ncbi:MAG: hypothetical protein ACJ8R9_23415 [Steroidobacteraceae bacterium]